MKLVHVEVERYTPEEVKEFDMDNDSTTRITISPFNLVINHDKVYDAEVRDQAIKALQEYIIELQKQVDAL